MSASLLRRRFAVALLASAALGAPARVLAQRAYFPAPGDGWEHRTPEQVGLSAQAVKDAIALAVAAEATTPRDLLEAQTITFGRAPHGEAIGPVRDRGAATGMIVRRGYIVGEWGDPSRVDVTHSVTKSFVTTTIGLAYDRKMIRSVNDPVRGYMAPIVALKGPPAGGATGKPTKGTLFDAFEVLEPFESEHNRRITWDHLLRQTSDWQGTLWSKPDWADRPKGDIEQWKVRPRSEPGSVYSYNDVRVNLMALASMNVWRRPLPQVLREYVMDPIGASPTWRWFGYDNSWVVMDGQLMQSVAGGGHWGGGMMISARDMARFGLLTLHKGKWGDRQLLSEEWIRMSTTPGPANDQYGYANYFLNTGRKAIPSAPESAFYHLGNGNNVIYVDPVNDLVVVMRWISTMRAVDSVVGKLIGGR